MVRKGHSGVFSYKDENKNVHLLYPVTKKDNVEGMDQVEQDVSEALTAANAAKKTADELKQAVEEGGGIGGAYVLKITFAAGFKGQTYTVTGGGKTKTGTVPDGLVVNVSVQNGSTEYTIACSTADGDAYTAKVTTGAYFGQYTAQLDTFTAIPPPPKNDKNSSTFSYNFRLALAAWHSL